MNNQAQNIKDVYSNFMAGLSILRKKQFDFLSGLIKRRDTKKLEEIHQEIKKYE